MNTRRELLRHFLDTFFDSEALAVSGDWKKTVIGVFAALISVGYIVLDTYWERYSALQSLDHSTRAIYQTELHSDLLLFAGVVMAATGLLTLLQWQSLFPNRRDCLALAGLPISARDVFLAKSGALLVIFTGYLFALNLPWAILFTTASSGHWQLNPNTFILIAATFLTNSAACCFVFFLLLALQGLLLNLLPARVFDRASLWTQGALFISILGSLPLIGRQPNAAWWPGAWFVDLWDAIALGDAKRARTALLGIAIPAVFALAAYLAGYHRHRRILLEASPGHGDTSESNSGSRMLEAWIPRPAEQAAFAFIWKTLVRSRGHRLLLLAWSGLALGWVVEGILDMPTPSLQNEGLYGMLVTVSPLALALLAVIALRHLFSLPVTHAAKWIFEIEEHRGASAWLAAVERFVVWCGIAPVCLAGLPASVAVLGWQRAIVVTALLFLTAALWFEALFRNWRKLPFTCTYLPARRPLAVTLVRYGIASTLLAGIAGLILYCSIEPAAFLSLFSLLLWSVWRMRGKRRAGWAACPILYEDIEEPEVKPLELGHLEPPVLSTSSATTPGPEFAFNLSTSRSFVPESVTSEIAESIHNRTFFASVFDDLRHGLRLIRRDPIVSLVIVATLTAAIGINASVFTVVNGYVLRPHISKDPDTFIGITPASASTDIPREASYAEYELFRNAARSLRQIAAFTKFAVMLGEEETGTPTLAVTCNFFDVEGAGRPLLGRLFVEDDCRTPGQAPVAVLSEAMWHSRFAADPNVIGRVVQMNNRPVPVVGVVRGGTSGWVVGPAVSVWVPYTSQPWFDPTRNLFKEEQYFWLELAGRMAPGSNDAAVRAELTSLVRAQDKLNFGRVTRILTTDGSWIQWVELTWNGRGLLLSTFFFGAFNLVLLIACANVATLLLSRAATRNREIAVRLSLGAPRSRLVRMLITESLVLAGIAGGLSWVVVNKLPEPLARYIILRSPDFPLNPDWRVLAWISAIVLATGFLAGLAPALEALKVDLVNSLKGFGGLFGGAAGTKRALGALVSAQVAMSMVLIVGAGLLSQAESRNLHGNPGYDPRHVVVAPIQRTGAVRVAAITNRLLNIPGVHSVALSNEIPLFYPDTVEMRPPERRDAVQTVAVFSASPRFLETMGIPLIGGREFIAADTNAAIVSEALARLFWRRSSPLGRQLELPDGTALTIVGIAKDIEPLRFGGSDNPALYRSRAMNDRQNVIAVRFDQRLSRPAVAVRAAIHEVEPNVPVMVRLMQAWIDQVTGEIWNFVSLILLLGILATILSAAGIYGAVSFAVNQSKRELGIRVALGARSLDIVRFVFLSGGKPVFHGLVVGLWLSLATAASLRKTLDTGPLRIDSSDPLLYVAAALLLVAAATLAMAFPARRGAGSDPVEALKCE